MIRDPIVEEVYQVRERLMNECGGDLSKLIERQKAMAVPTGMKTATANQVRAAVTKLEAAAVELGTS